jgi:hypothetical protein
MMKYINVVFVVVLAVAMTIIASNFKFLVDVAPGALVAAASAGIEVGFAIATAVAQLIAEAFAIAFLAVTLSFIIYNLMLLWKDIRPALILLLASIADGSLFAAIFWTAVQLAISVLDGSLFVAILRYIRRHPVRVALPAGVYAALVACLILLTPPPHTAGRDLVVTLDVSHSMSAEDYETVLR